MAKIFANEMRAAAEAAEVYNCPIILGDQDFNQTTSRIKQVFVQSLKDIATPLKGWRSLYSDLSTLGKTTLGGQGDDNFGPGDVFDPTLLAGAPTSILRYVLAILIKAPKVGIPVFSLFVYSVLQSVAEDLSAPIALTDMPGADVVSETLLTLGVNVLEVVLLGMVFLQALLLERNSILADNIYAECVKAKALPGKSKTVVAILGMAHCNGVKDLLSRPNE
jgi:pheromone shutdown protein TraB